MKTKYERKQDSREAWLRRLKMYWNTASFPRFTARLGEIFEVDFGENVGTEFSGRHLAICLKDSLPSDERILVIPLTTKYLEYNIADDDIVEVTSLNGTSIKAGASLHEARWISKLRIFRASKILEEPDTVVNPVKGCVIISKERQKRWTTL